MFIHREDMNPEQLAACDGACAMLLTLADLVRQSVEEEEIDPASGVLTVQMYLGICEILQGRRPARCGAEDEIVAGWTENIDRIQEGEP